MVIPVGACTSPKIRPEVIAAGQSDQRVRNPANTNPRKKSSSAIGANPTIITTARTAITMLGLPTPSSPPMSSWSGFSTRLANSPAAM